MLQGSFTQESEIDDVNPKYENILEEQKEIRRRYFALCESCFWCATLIEFSHTDVNIPGSNWCPACHKYRMTIMGLDQFSNLNHQ